MRAVPAARRDACFPLKPEVRRYRCGGLLSGRSKARLRSASSALRTAGDCYDSERDKSGRHDRSMRYDLNDGRH